MKEERPKAGNSASTEGASATCHNIQRLNLGNLTGQEVTSDAVEGEGGNPATWCDVRVTPIESACWLRTDWAMLARTVGNLRARLDTVNASRAGHLAFRAGWLEDIARQMARVPVVAAGPWDRDYAPDCVLS